MKRLFIVLAILLSISLVGCGNKEAIEPIDVNNYEYQELGEMYFNDLLDGEFDSAYEYYPHDEAMNKAVNARYYKNLMADIESQYGRPVEVEESFIVEVEGYIIVSIPVQYESENMNYNVVFNEAKEIAGFNIGEYAKE